MTKFILLSLLSLVSVMVTWQCNQLLERILCGVLVKIIPEKYGRCTGCYNKTEIMSQTMLNTIQSMNFPKYQAHGHLSRSYIKVTFFKKKRAVFWNRTCFHYRTTFWTISFHDPGPVILMQWWHSENRTGDKKFVRHVLKQTSISAIELITCICISLARLFLDKNLRYCYSLGVIVVVAASCKWHLCYYWRYLLETWSMFSLYKEQSILSRETIQNTSFLELCPFFDVDF